MSLKADTEIIIRVDRSIQPASEAWVRSMIHPELECRGPSEYSLGQVDLWLHDKQQDGGIVDGKTVYNYLKDHNLLDSCLGLADLVAIQKLGIKVFRYFFNGQAVFAWRALAQLAGPNILVPYLLELGGEVLLHWAYYPGLSLKKQNPALRFPKELM